MDAVSARTEIACRCKGAFSVTRRAIPPRGPAAQFTPARRPHSDIDCIAGTITFIE